MTIQNETYNIGDRVVIEIKQGGLSFSKIGTIVRVTYSSASIYCYLIRIDEPKNFTQVYCSHQEILQKL